MLILKLFVFLVTNISVITCTDTDPEEINVVIYENITCNVNKEYKLPAGAKLVVKVKNKSMRKIINATVNKDTNDQTQGEEFILEEFNLTTFKPLYIPNLNFNKTYTLFFKFLFKSEKNKNQNMHDHVHPMCNTRISFSPINDTAAVIQDFGKDAWHAYVAIVGGVAGIVIIALLATTMYYKRKAKKLSKLIRIERRAERNESDERDRYSSNPRKDKKISPILTNSRNSDIYEDPKITLGVTTMPPALPTTPRPNRDYNCTLKKPASPSMTLKSNAAHKSLTRPRAPDTETKINIAQRPRLSLPKEEIYEAAAEEDTYEEPPVLPSRPERPTPTTLTKKPEQQERIGTIPKKLTKPTPENTVKPRPGKVANAFEEKLGKTMPNIPMDGLKPPIGKFGKTMPNIPMDGLRPPGVKQVHKPAVPNSKPTPPRNNVVQVPIRQIPEPSSLKKTPLIRPKPHVKPKTPPSPTTEQGQFSNGERCDSSDEDWTYEPLTQYNIYNN